MWVTLEQKIPAGTFCAILDPDEIFQDQVCCYLQLNGNALYCLRHPGCGLASEAQGGKVQVLKCRPCQRECSVIEAI